MITIAILGIAFAGILAGFATAIRMSSIHRGQANAGVVLVSAADSVKSQTYVSCNPGPVTTSSYTPTSGVTLPSGWVASNVTIVSVQKWNGTAFQASCPATDQGLQLITIKATSPDNGSSSEQVDVVKRTTS